MPCEIRNASRLLACGILLSLAGCATLDWTMFDKKEQKATARNPVTQIVCLWEPAEGRDAKGIPCKGFAGQILFLANRGVLPVTVEGDVRIYLFDNLGSVEEQSKPIHTFDFDSPSWAQTYVNGTLGPSYNVFVPYTRRGIHNATCSLRVRLSPKTGPVIFSDMTNIELVTVHSLKDPLNPAADVRVEQTAPEDITANLKSRKTTTIPLQPQSTDAEGIVELSKTPANDIQLANHQVETGAKVRDPSETRISQLEKMVKDLQAQQTLTQRPRVDEARKVAEPQAFTESVNNEMQFRFRAPRPMTTPLDDFMDPTLTPTKAAVRANDLTAASPRRRHPLVDDSDPAERQRAPRTKAHPLSDLDGEDDRAPTSTTRSPSQRHPLLDDAESQPRRPSTSSRVIRATHPLADTESDPFEPIDPDQPDGNVGVR